MPGLAPAGEILSCYAARKYPKKRAHRPGPAGFPRSGLPDRPASELAFGSDNEAGLPRSDSPPLGGSEGKDGALPIPLMYALSI